MVWRGSPATMSSQTFRKLACFQKSVSKASACPICPLLPALSLAFYRKSEHQGAERRNMGGSGQGLPNSLYSIINLQKAAPRSMDASMPQLKLPNIEDVVAIDIHTHAEEPCGLHGDDGYDDFQERMAEYFKLPPTMQGFYPNDHMAYPLYEVINDGGAIALFRTGQTGVGSGMPGGMGMRLK